MAEEGECSSSAAEDSDTDSILCEVESEPEEEKDGDRVPPEKLQQLGLSEKLRGMLGNRHLRHLLSEIDQSQDPARMLQRAMQIQIFVEFADECLRVCGLREEENM